MFGHCVNYDALHRKVQARLFRKHNPYSHYGNAVYNFMKERAIAYRDTSAFLSVDAKCKVSFGKPDFLLQLLQG